MASITSRGYEIQISRVSGQPTTMDLVAFDANGTQYGLHIEGLKDKPALAKAVLQIIAEFWPDFAWDFTADKNRSITSVGADDQ